jgi:hypothetical protein
MDEILTRAQIEERFPNEWVMVEDPDLDEQNEVIRGKVISHSPDRLTAYRALFNSKAKRCATLFTGTVAPGVEILI